jgi:hypothetical protein
VRCSCAEPAGRGVVLCWLRVEPARLGRDVGVVGVRQLPAELGVPCVAGLLCGLRGLHCLRSPPAAVAAVGAHSSGADTARLPWPPVASAWREAYNARIPWLLAAGAWRGTAARACQRCAYDNPRTMLSSLRCAALVILLSVLRLNPAGLRAQPCLPLARRRQPGAQKPHKH